MKEEMVPTELAHGMLAREDVWAHKVMEEAAELIQEIVKMFLWGPWSTHPTDRPELTNVDRVKAEWHDLNMAYRNLFVNSQPNELAVPLTEFVIVCRAIPDGWRASTYGQRLNSHVELTGRHATAIDAAMELTLQLKKGVSLGST